MSSGFTRRQFLRLSGVTLAAAVLPVPPEPESPSNAPYPRPRRDGPVRMGRAIHTLILYDAPRPDAERVGIRHQQEVVPIIREIRAPGLNDYNDLWYETPDGYAFSAWVQPMWVWPPQHTHYELGDWGFWGEICVPYTDARDQPRPESGVAYRFYNGTIYHVVDVTVDGLGIGWYKVYDELPPPTHQWVLARDVRRIPREELAPIHPFAGAKRIEADLVACRVTCFEGNRVVFITPCSPGIGMRAREDGTIENLGTPVGEQCVLLKQPSRHMSNRPQKEDDPWPAEFFDLPGVPWNTFFHRSGTAIHGTYWHNDFGVPRSHGCLNVPTDAARWIYRWTYPIGGAEDSYVQSDCGVGTPITIFE